MRTTITILLFTLFLGLNAHSQRNFARQSLGLSIGAGLYHDKLGDSKPGLITGLDYRYMLTRKFGLVGSWQFDVINSKNRPDHPECEYNAVSHNFNAGIYHEIARFNRFVVGASAGMGVSFFYLEQDQRERIFSYNAYGQVLYGIGKRSNPWGNIFLRYRGTGFASLQHTLNDEFPTTSTPIQAFKQDVSVGISIYLDNRNNRPAADFKKQPRIVHSETRYEVQKVPIINVLHDCATCKDIFSAEFYFPRGKHNVLEAHRPDLRRIANHVIDNENLRIEGSAYACIAGTIKEQMKWSVDRATEITETFIALGVPKDRIDIKPMGADTDMVGKVHDFAQRVEIKVVE